MHGPSTRVGAIDLELKFTEAALGNLQLADYRNFAHGRHHWLAKQGEVSAVLALVTNADRALAERTLDLIPQGVPRARIMIPGEGTEATLLSLVAALRITGWAGASRGVDPGRPGVPEFGRRLYNLPLPKAIHNTAAGTSERDAVAIGRKAGISTERLAEAGELVYWHRALNSFRKKLEEASFGGIVFDYDGTVVDTRDRFRPPSVEMAEEFIRLLDGGVRLAIASGRGASVRRDLQTCVPRSLWDRVLIGYYNGAEIARLDDDGAPDGRDETGEPLRALATALRAQQELSLAAKQTDRPRQITLEAARVLPESRLWDLAHQVILIAGATDARVTRSSHSIDIFEATASKLNVVVRLRNEFADGGRVDRRRPRSLARQRL